MLSSNYNIPLLREKLNTEGYCYLPKILDSQLKNYLKVSSKFLSQYIDSELNLYKNNEDFNKFPVSIKNDDNSSKGIYGPHLGQTFITFLTPFLSHISGKNLVPTFSYFRQYKALNSLKKHKDRPSCQYAVSIQIDKSSNKPWPFYLQDLNGKEVKFKPDLGDIIFYKGEELEHWRNELPYDYSSHLFLGWVDGDNSHYRKHWFDGREQLEINKY